MNEFSGRLSREGARNSPPPPVRAFVDPVHGFAGAPLVFDRAECRTLGDIIAKVPLANEALRPLLRVKLGDAVIVDPSLYHRVIPKLDAFITVVLPVEGGDNNLLGTIAAIALIGASVFVSAGLATPFLGAAFASGTLGANLLAAGLSLGASLLLQGLNAPKAAKTDAPDEVGTAAAQNGFEPGAYLQRVLGRRRVTPQHVMPPYTEIDGKDQIVTAVYGLAGPHALSEIRIGDSDIAGATDVSYEIREGFASDTALTLVTKTVIEKQPGLALSEFKTLTDSTDGNIVDTAAAVFNPFWHRVETQKGPDLARLMFTLPQGIGVVSGFGATVTSMRLRLRKKGAGSWTNLPEFIIRGKQPGTPLRISLDIKWVASGSMPGSSTSFPSFSATSSTRGWYQKVNRWPVSGTLRWAADSYFTSTWPHSVNYIDGSRIEVHLDTTTFAQDAAYEIELIRGFPGVPNNVSGYNAGDQTYANHNDFYTSRSSGGNQIIPFDPADRPATIVLAALQSIWNEYPFDLTGQPTALLAIRARNRSIDSVTCLAEGYAEDWNGTSWVANQKTRNPAAWYREVLRGELNAAPVPDSLIDGANLVDWHEWCASEGHELNAVVQGQPVSEVLGIAAQAGFARPKFGVRHGVVIDRPRDMVGLLTLRNAAGFSFEKPFGRMPHALRVQLADEADDFKVREITVYGDGYAAVPATGFAEATRFESVSYPGITNEAQATARARRDLRFGRYRSRLVSFTLDIEHLEFGLGDLVGLQTDILGQMGGQGRVVEVLVGGGLVTGLVLDEARDFTKADADGAGRGALIRLADGTLLSKEVTGDDSDLATVLFATPFAMPTGPDGDLIGPGTLVATGTLDHETRPVLIWDLAPGPDLTCRVVAIDYAADEIYGGPWTPPPQPTLISILTTLGLTTGLKLALDAGDSGSYPGTGQTWLDTSGGGFDFWRGTGSGSDGADPTFGGTAGNRSSNERFSSDGGDFFTYDQASPEPWMNAMHQADAKLTVACWVYLTNNVSRRLAGTRNASTNVGWMLQASSTGKVSFVVSNGTTNVASIESTDTIPTDKWVMVVASLDFDAGTGWIGFDDKLTAVTPAFTGTPSAAAATNTMRIFAVGGSTANLPASGSLIALFPAWEGVALTSSQIAALRNATKARFGA